MSQSSSSSGKKKDVYSIRVSSSHTTRSGVVMTMIVGETTFVDLQKWVYQHKIMLKKEKDIEFWCGYPPKVISYPHPTCIVSDYIPPQEHVLVKSTTTPTTPTTTTSSSSRPKRRKAAQDAMDSFQDTIQYQKDILRQESNKRKKKTTSSKNTTIHKATNEKAMAAAHSRRMAKQYPGGIKLGSTATTSNPTTTPKKKKQISLGSTTEDLTTTLLSSVVSGGNNNNNKKMVSMVIRKAMKNAVNQQYEINRATVRVASLLSQEKPKFIPTSTGTTMRVQYTKGIQGRGVYEESIDIITKETLAEVISTVYHDEDSKEMLQCNNMAQLSPRVFWSLLYHYPNNSSTNDILPLLQPNFNWNFLTKGRVITLSEKAQENLRQQQTNNDKEDEKNIQATNDAIQQVEHAMIMSSSTYTTNLGQRSAQAAIQRQQKLQQKEEWSIETPKDVDEDELQQCIKEANDDQKTDKEIISIVSILINQCQIHNWRELANVDTSSANNALLKNFLSNTITKINEEILESWIHVAQQYSLEEIMLEILDGNEDVFHLLCTYANAGTPKDLSLWESMPSLLYDTLVEKHCLKEEEKITTHQLQTWCTRARIALTTYPWLQDFITPIHD